MKKITKMNLQCQKIGGKFLLGPHDPILDLLEYSGTKKIHT